MDLHLTFARTRPMLTDDLRLRDRVETLVARKTRVKPFFRPSWMPATARPRRNHHVVHRHALPTYHRPDGSLPFTADDEGGYFFASGLDLAGADDPRLGPLWRACVAASPLSYRFRLTVGPSACFDGLTLTFETTKGTSEYGTEVTYWADRPRDLAQWIDLFLQAGRIKRHRIPRPRRPRNALAPIDHEQGGLAHLPPDARWLDLCFRVLHSMPGEPPLVPRDLHCEVWADPDEYPPLRDQLNAISRRWTTTSDLAYQPDFDPFQAPELTHAAEYRFAVAAYLGRERDFDDPTIQVDVVHGPRGSFLELASALGVESIEKYAG